MVSSGAQPPAPAAKPPPTKKKGKGEEEPPELSEEDQALKDRLDLCVSRIVEPGADAGLLPAAVAAIAGDVRASTTSMSAVPKPLKFLRAHYDALKEAHGLLGGAPGGASLADVLSVLAISAGPRGGRECLLFRLAGEQVGGWRCCAPCEHWRGRGGRRPRLRRAPRALRAVPPVPDASLLLPHQGPVGAWGHEYVRNLAGEIGEAWASRRAEGGGTDDLLTLVNQIVPYHMAHNAGRGRAGRGWGVAGSRWREKARPPLRPRPTSPLPEPEAVDLLLEVDRLDLLPPLVDSKNVGRAALYLCACAPYLPEPDDASALRAAAACYATTGRHFDAVRVALQLGDVDAVATRFAAAADNEKVQLAYLLARQGVALDFETGPAAIADDALRAAVADVASAARTPERFAALARDLDVVEPRSPDDIYKRKQYSARGSERQIGAWCWEPLPTRPSFPLSPVHLAGGRAPAGAAADSSRANLAATLVNAFVNCGHGSDSLMAPPGDDGGAGAAWVFKNKDAGKAAAAASLGMIARWDVDGGLPVGGGGGEGERLSARRHQPTRLHPLPSSSHSSWTSICTRPTPRSSPAPCSASASCAAACGTSTTPRLRCSTILCRPTMRPFAAAPSPGWASPTPARRATRWRNCSSPSSPTTTRPSRSRARPLCPSASSLPDARTSPRWKPYSRRS